VEGDNNVDNEDLTLWSEKAGAPAGHGWRMKRSGGDEVSREDLTLSFKCPNGESECIRFPMYGTNPIFGATKPTVLGEGLCSADSL